MALFFILFFSYFKTILNKHVFFPFKKMTIESLNKSKTISDFIDFNIYTNIKLGTPPKNIAHFILRSNSFFSFRTLDLQSHEISEYKNIEKTILESLNNYYTIKSSSSFEIIDNEFGIYSDIYYLNDITGKEKAYKLQFNIRPGDIKEKLFGTIDIYSQNIPYNEYYMYLFKVLQDNGVIDGYYITFLYGEYNLDDDTFNYFNDDYSNILGNLILGESPHELFPDKYKADNEIKKYGNFQLYINQIKFKSKISNQTESSKSINFRFTSQFIKGSNEFKNEIDKIFFNELIKNNLCRIDIIEENILIAKDTVYSCENNNIVKNKIKYFPNLYFEIKESNLTFLFNYKELFKLNHNRVYFLIIFKNNNWEFGEIFLRKYITSFNYDLHTISFYKEQVDNLLSKN